MAAKRTVVWLRNDLRIHDNILINKAAKLAKDSASDFICVYCFDPRHYKKTKYRSMKTGVFRAQFLRESVTNMRNNLKLLGSDLLVAYEKPELTIRRILEGTTGSNVFVHGEVTHEEIRTENAVEKCAQQTGAIFHRIFGGNTLYHPEDIPFRPELSDLPNTFTPFKQKVEKICTIRPVLPTLKKGQIPSTSKETLSPFLHPQCGFDYLPTLSDLGFTTLESESANSGLDGRGVMRFEGGESAALQRVHDWMFRDDKLREYFDIRNGMLGEGYSSKLSPWLAAGCISPRYIYYECKRYEKERGVSNKSTYWLVFELIWRDFFRFLCAKHGRSVFFEWGPVPPRDKTWSLDADLIHKWKTGTTGQPLVDANMRELLYTGWMSNRGRQNVASYLVLDLGIDWRVGADHFESLLLDHDVCSNYGNWNSAAGLLGGRVNKFNCVKQTKDYDINGDYLRHWLPELQRVPAPAIYEPSRLALADQQKYGVKIGIDYPRIVKTSGFSSSAPSGTKPITNFFPKSGGGKKEKSSGDDSGFIIFRGGEEVRGTESTGGRGRGKKRRGRGGGVQHL